MIFAKGDMVKFLGAVATNNGNAMIAGDVVYVTRPNEDYESDVEVVYDGLRFTVQPEDLEWISGR